MTTTAPNVVKVAGKSTVERPVTLPALTETNMASTHEMPRSVEGGSLGSTVPSAISARKPKTIRRGVESLLGNTFSRVVFTRRSRPNVADHGQYTREPVYVLPWAPETRQPKRRYNLGRGRDVSSEGNDGAAHRQQQPQDGLSEDLGHGPLQFPLPVLHARGHPVPGQEPHPDPGGDAHLRRGVPGAGRHQGPGNGRRAARQARGRHVRRVAQGPRLRGRNHDDQWVPSEGEPGWSCRSRPRPRQHLPRYPPAREVRLHNAPKPLREGLASADGGPRDAPLAGQDQRRRDARRQRRRDRGHGEADARLSHARQVHRAHAPKRRHRRLALPLTLYPWA